MSRKLVSKKVREAAVKSYVKDGVSIADAAKNSGVGYESVRRWLREAGIDTSRSKNSNSSLSKIRMKSGKYPRGNANWTSGEDEILRDAVLSGMTVGETSELLGRTKASIYARKMNLIGRGLIEDPSTRFPMPDDIKRPRKVETLVEETAPEIEAILEEIEAEVETMESNDTPEDESNNISIPKFEDLARIVNEYGVNVSLSITAMGNVDIMMSK